MSLVVGQIHWTIGTCSDVGRLFQRTCHRGAAWVLIASQLPSSSCRRRRSTYGLQVFVDVMWIISSGSPWVHASRRSANIPEMVDGGAGRGGGGESRRGDQPNKKNNRPVEEFGENINDNLPTTPVSAWRWVEHYLFTRIHCLVDTFTTSIRTVHWPRW